MTKVSGHVEQQKDSVCLFSYLFRYAVAMVKRGQVWTANKSVQHAPLSCIAFLSLSLSLFLFLCTWNQGRRMFRDSRPIALRKLNPFSNRKHRTSDSIHSDEDPLLDEEAAFNLLNSPTSPIHPSSSANSARRSSPSATQPSSTTKQQEGKGFLSWFIKKKVYSPRTISLGADGKSPSSL